MNDPLRELLSGETEADAPALSEAGRSLTHGELAAAVARVAGGLADRLEGSEEPPRVALLLPPGVDWVAVFLGVLRSGAVAVPLSPLHPHGELEHVVSDSDPALLVAAGGLAERLEPFTANGGRRLVGAEELLDSGGGRDLPPLPPPDHPATILYTSGTTRRPKGVVATHGSLGAQVASVTGAWEIGPDDRLLHTLPLHHVHGIVNALLCPLAAGGAVELAGKLDAGAAWRRIAEGGEAGSPRITLFMGVPTMYSRLLSAWEEAPPPVRRTWSEAASRVRLFVSGSAALPAPLWERFREVTGQPILERYGMTEIGMALGNPLHGERRAGFVGRPMPGVEVRLVDEGGEPIAAEGTPGGIEVRGPTLFAGYWRLPEATREAFRGGDDDGGRGWFVTGDEAVVERGAYRILGRSSVDILKSGGYKISALETESALLALPEVAECAVVGLPDPEWGERVAAAVVPAAGASEGELTLDALRDALADRLAVYKLPTRLLVVRELPRNALGKVVKPRVGELFASPEEGGGPG